MPAHTERGMVIFRHWDAQDGLNEITRQFNTLNELFAFCLQKDPTLLVDRIIIEGLDDNNDARTVTLVFQSVTMAEH